MKEKVSYLIDSFVDYKEIKRMVVMAAVTNQTNYLDISEYNDSLDINDQIKPEKVVRFGVAIAHESDIQNMSEELGKVIARGKALKNRSCFGKISYQLGIHPRTVDIENILKREMEHFKSNPGYYIKGYDKMKSRYQEKKNLIKISGSEGDTTYIGYPNKSFSEPETIRSGTTYVGYLNTTK